MSSSVAQRHSVQISTRAHRWLQEAAEIEHASMGHVLERALERYRAEVITRLHNTMWAELAEEDPDAIAALRQEYECWDQVVSDGLPEDRA
ncbi:MAG TPA: hypothetical protein VFN57_15550 [Thermomicrobiaceae bacterium]|nr:hypothetical protein [Thermomicrobiaceae bacterium]